MVWLSRQIWNCGQATEGLPVQRYVNGDKEKQVSFSKSQRAAGSLTCLAFF